MSASDGGRVLFGNAKRELGLIGMAGDFLHNHTPCISLNVMVIASHEIRTVLSKFIEREANAEICSEQDCVENAFNTDCVSKVLSCLDGAAPDVLFFDVRVSSVSIEQVAEACNQKKTLLVLISAVEAFQPLLRASASWAMRRPFSSGVSARVGMAISKNAMQRDCLNLVIFFTYFLM